MGVNAGAWSELIDLEYIRHFVPKGGSSIKFAIAEDIVLSEVRFKLRSLAADQKYIFMEVDGSATKLNLIQDFFFALSRQIDWEGLAQARTEVLFGEHGFKWPNAGKACSLAELAEVNDIAPNLISYNFDKWLTTRILRDPDMSQDFREAMAHLCRSRITVDAATVSTPVLDWLRGDLRILSALRPMAIGAKIARHNARSMLRSLCHWVALSGSPGLVVALDLRWLSERGPSKFGVRFTPAAVLNVFEVIRQLIDDAERLEGLFLVIEARDALLDGDDARRTLDKYPALKGRVDLDVRALQHSNPIAPLVRFDSHGNGADFRTNGVKPFSAERVAIEALRAGVPNETAIRLLGGGEEAFCKEFVENLRQMARADGQPEIVEGKILLGEFGSGKSHCLGYMAQHAQNQNFIVSPIAISKETPLFSLEKVYAAAIRNAVVPGINDDVMSVAVGRLDGASPQFQALEEWASSEKSELSPLFAAILYVLSKDILGAEDRTAIARFLSGARLGAGKISGWLRAAGARKLFQIRPVKAPELALQRLRFAPALFRAVGFSGWCVLLDEVELISRYSTLQRGKSYAELARWLALDRATAVPGILSAATLVQDFPSVVIRNRLDDEKIPLQFEARDLPGYKRMAVAGMRAIESSRNALSAPDLSKLERDVAVVAELYQRSYDWAPSSRDIGELLGSKTMRQYMKSWITDWDIQRLYGFKDTIVNVDKPKTNLDEDKNFETPPPESSEDDA